jgi:hypothetical protein
MITSKEFKEIFELDSKCRIPKNTLTLFNKQIKGAYLLYLEILNIKSKKFKNVDGTELRAYFTPYNHGFQQFVETLGSNSKFEVYYIDINNNRPIPFWTYTKYKNEVVSGIKNSAYKIFEAKVLLNLKAKYSKYGISFKYFDYATTSCDFRRTHPNQAIWWDSIIFNSLFYTNTNKHFKELVDYRIKNVITNRHGIWDGDIPEPIQRLINQIKNNYEL